MPASQGRFFVTRFTTPGMAYFSNSFTFHNRTDLVFSVKCIENIFLCGEWVKPQGSTEDFEYIKNSSLPKPKIEFSFN